MAPCKVQWGITTYTLPYSPRAKQIFAYAGDEAKRLGAQKDWYRAFIIRLVKRRRNFSV